jgi:hypothetical protein
MSDCEALLVGGESRAVEQFGLQLAEDERGAPPQHVLGHVHVAEQVVADVEDLVALEFEARLDGTGIAPVVDLPELERSPVRAEETRLLVDDLEGRLVWEKKRGLPAATTTSRTARATSHSGPCGSKHQLIMAWV